MLDTSLNSLWFIYAGKTVSLSQTQQYGWSPATFFKAHQG